MDNTQQPQDYYGSYQETPYSTNRPPNTATRPPYTSAAHAPTQQDQAAPPWTPLQGHDSHPYGFRYDFPAPPPGGGGFGGPRFPPPFGFDPTVPPPPFGCPPHGHYPNMVPPAASSSPVPSTFQTVKHPFGPGPQSARYDPDSGHSPLFPPRCNEPDRRAGTPRRAEDEAGLQRSQDKQWIRRFLQNREKTSRSPQRPQPPQHVVDLKQALYRAAELVSQLAEACDSLRSSVEEDRVWTPSYSGALELKQELQDTLSVLTDSLTLARWKAKLSRVAQRRSRRQRSRRLLQLEEKQREKRSAEKEAAIDKWRLQQIQQVEEKKKEQELKLAADAVLCEVRKKQADVKRMQDVLRSLEKLRRLRKEAASRKALLQNELMLTRAHELPEILQSLRAALLLTGIVTEPGCDDAFRERLEQLRSVMKRRTAVYSVEEKALMVMLEGEQEEERRREQERQMKKEREKQLQRRRRVDGILFGEELPADSVLQPFTHFYTQADVSLHALLQIRREWDVFVVAADHPDASPVPQSWVLPDPPSDQAWASALQPAHPDGDHL